MSHRKKDQLLDDLNVRLLSLLIEDAQLSLEELAQKTASSRTVVWNRIQKLCKNKVITGYTVRIDPEKLGIRETFFISVVCKSHDRAWLKAFREAVNSMDEIVEAHRLAGETDYLLKVQVADSRAFDLFYRNLIAKVSMQSVTSNMSMETIKPHAGPPLSSLPLNGASSKKGPL